MAVWPAVGNESEGSIVASVLFQSEHRPPTVVPPESTTQSSREHPFLAAGLAALLVIVAARAAGVQYVKVFMLRLLAEIVEVSEGEIDMRIVSEDATPCCCFLSSLGAAPASSSRGRRRREVQLPF